jgi:hypothetical protein
LCARSLSAEDIEAFAYRQLGATEDGNRWRVFDKSKLEFLQPTSAAPTQQPCEDVEGGEQGGGAVALVVMRHRASATGLERQARLGPVKRLDLALLVDREDDGMRRRIDIEANDVLELVGELRVVRQFTDQSVI